MKFYVSTYTEGFFGEGPNGSKGIYLCDFDESTKTIKILNSFSETTNPSFIKLSNNKKNLFAATEKLPPSSVSKYAVDENGNLSLNDTYELDYRSCCYISPNEENYFVAVANYGSGEVFALALDEDLKFLKITSEFKNIEVGPNKQRQDLPHAHSIRLIESLNTYVACDLGCDEINFYDYKIGGFLSRSSIKGIKVPPGYGPRHTDNSKDGKYLYVTCELENRVLTYELINKQYKLIQDVSSLPKEYEGTNTCADIHISDNDKYVFVSNRGHDSIVEYQKQNDGTLKQIACIKCNGKGPRNFAVTNNYLICANQDSNDVSIFEIQNGLLTGEVLAKQEFISPVCIEIL